MKGLYTKEIKLPKEEYQPNQEIIDEINETIGLEVTHPRNDDVLYTWEDIN